MMECPSCSWDHAAIEHLVQNRCGDFVDEGHSSFRILAQKIQRDLLLLRWRLGFLRRQLITACRLILLDHFVGGVIYKHALGSHGSGCDQGCYKDRYAD